jgi:hypothetical protein
MTVFVYVNTSKQVGDPEHIKLFANADAAETWFEENDPEGVAFASASRTALRHARDPGAGDGLAGARIASAIASQRLESKRAALARPLAGQICSE